MQKDQWRRGFIAPIRVMQPQPLADEAAGNRPTEDRCHALKPFKETGKRKTSFLKKRSKRLLLLGVRASPATYAESQKFFGSFFQKRTAFFVTFRLSPAKTKAGKAAFRQNSAASARDGAAP
jgi:hypothetical protein